MTSKHRYNYKDCDSTGLSNGARFLKTLKTLLGENYKEWYKHSSLDTVLQISHECIFGETGSYRPGLKLRLAFLDRSDVQTKETKDGHACYHAVAIDALAAGVITQAQYFSLTKE